MIDFTDIPQEQLLARGQYSIVRRAREDNLKKLRTICEQQNIASLAVLRDIQASDYVAQHLGIMREHLEEMAEIVLEIESLSKQLDLLSPLAFPE